MGRENQPTSLADLAARGSKGALVDEEATVIVVCHKCVRVLYDTRENNFITTTVAEQTARGHGNSFSPGHHTSVISENPVKSLEETLAVNENFKSRPTSPLRQNFFIPAK